jgi:hypothetical protein
MANDRLDIGSDPPVLVGGGGSSLIWVNFAQGQTPQNPHGVPINAPSPSNPGNYACSKITNAPVRLFFNDGTTPGPAGEQPLPIANAKTWYIRFAVPGPIKRRKKAKR